MITLNTNALTTYQSTLKGMEAINAAKKDALVQNELSEAVVFASANSVCKTMEPSKIGSVVGGTEEQQGMFSNSNSEPLPPEAGDMLNAKA